MPEITSRSLTRSRIEKLGKREEMDYTQKAAPEDCPWGDDDPSQYDMNESAKIEPVASRSQASLNRDAGMWAVGPNGTNLADLPQAEPLITDSQFLMLVGVVFVGGALTGYLMSSWLAAPKVKVDPLDVAQAQVAQL